MLSGVEKGRRESPGRSVQFGNDRGNFHEIRAGAYDAQDVEWLRHWGVNGAASGGSYQGAAGRGSRSPEVCRLKVYVGGRCSRNGAARAKTIRRGVEDIPFRG